MYVISLVVKNEFGVMQRVMGEFTRNKINVETIVVGKCEQPGKSRMVLSVIDKNDAVTAMGRLEKLQDVYDSELVTEGGQSAYALLSTSKGNVGVVHFDSHLDTGRGRVHLLDHGQPIYRVMKEGHIRPEDYIQVGLRAHYTKDYYDWERLIGMNYHTMAEVERRGWPAVMERVLNEAKKHTKYLYVSFDVDVLDPAVEPGTGTPVPGGLTMREAIPIVRRLCAETRLVGFDIVEVAPQLDPTYRSAMNANALMHACLSGVAMRKKGLTQPWYVSPLTSDHGQDNYFGDKK